jgi:hypothetical protein
MQYEQINLLLLKMLDTLWFSTHKSNKQRNHFACINISISLKTNVYAINCYQKLHDLKRNRKIKMVAPMPIAVTVSEQSQAAFSCPAHFSSERQTQSSCQLLAS